MIVSPYKNSTTLQPAASFNLQAVFLRKVKTMNNALMHRFFKVFMRDFIFREINLKVQNDQYDEFLLGAATALYNIYVHEVHHNDTPEFSDFLKRLNELAEQHIRECKEGEKS